MHDRNALRAEIERLASLGLDELRREREARTYFAEFLNLLNKGELRAAEKIGGKWQVNHWVKKGILLGFRLGELRKIEVGSEPKQLTFIDKDTYPVRHYSETDRVRIVPGGTAIRSGAYLAPSVVVMPPAYVNVGAYVDEGAMIDSHALVGSCAQVGKRVHLSAASQLGGVLEPVGALPVIVEDDAMIGGNCGIYEGTIIEEKAVIGTGVILNGSTPVYDVVNGRIYRKTDEQPLIIPKGAVVVAGARRVKNDFAEAHGLSIYAPIIIKYRDEKTDKATTLEELLR
ncbi:MAG: 2,3,4,5-tetrahydropyridine-2,6-dicarboxylate N-succinyltransferase [Chloroherpetonaceae bacterium]|nr:2,3,4,5-tetrahydropyridine-2,6-dicarboxylate N-succinyltransferase [Chloroherpetonaceae bacterium]MDW8438655.1 2,3,4,5-tetrahydropyridine-2,6-dicarboxylate N-succinyltransferase [Chloroherpetonaceae bacterium]